MIAVEHPKMKYKLQLAESKRRHKKEPNIKKTSRVKTPKIRVKYGEREQAKC